jgi:endogenous inhibitor of DNA gyrase (YacG/DUF329 family)
MPDELIASPPSCPVCGKPATAARRPFCSPRCQQVDLHRWLSESYVIPGTELPVDRDPEADDR